MVPGYCIVLPLTRISRARLGFLRNALKRCSVVFEQILDNYVVQCLRVVSDLFISILGYDKTVADLGAEGFGDAH